MVSAEDIPQSVVEAARRERERAIEETEGLNLYDPRRLQTDTLKCSLAAALAEYERLGRYLISLDGQGLGRVAKAAGLRLIRDDEATVERMAEAIHAAASQPSSDDYWKSLARAALTAAAQGGED